MFFSMILKIKKYVTFNVYTQYLDKYLNAK
jgi:hypothetical protein